MKKALQPEWTIRVADAATGGSRDVWQASTERGSTPSVTNLHWAAGDRLVFLSSADGWPHLYSVPAGGGAPLLLTPGKYVVEQISLSPDRQLLLFAGNTGSDSKDVDRRHVVMVSVDKAEAKVLTPGEGLEWTPVVTGDGKSIVFLSATGQRPPKPTVLSINGGPQKVLGKSRLAEYPVAALAPPKQVIFKSPDGFEIHGRLFEKPGQATKKPAIVFVHGGPQRKMLLGWHYSAYYSNAYALNQYLASRGYVVLSVNYRLGIGNGRSFQYPGKTGARGAAEYADVKAAGEFLRSLLQVDPDCIGIYGGSYGGFLTALALGRDSDLCGGSRYSWRAPLSLSQGECRS